MARAGKMRYGAEGQCKGCGKPRGSGEVHSITECEATKKEREEMVKEFDQEESRRWKYWSDEVKVRMVLSGGKSNRATAKRAELVESGSGDHHCDHH
jgi:hypothetical protein